MKYALLALFAVVLWSSAASAERLPADAPNTLREILAEPEFGSREEHISLWESLKLRSQQYLKQLWEKFKRAMPSIDIPDIGLRSTFDGLAAFFVFAKYVFYAVVFAAVGYILYRFFKLISPRLARKTGEYLLVSSPVEDTRTSWSNDQLKTLFEQQRFAELLAAMRLMMRQRILAAGSLLPIATDRELLRLASEHENNLPLFRTIALLFERMAFAQSSADSGAITLLYRQFSESEQHR